MVWQVSRGDDPAGGDALAGWIDSRCSGRMARVRFQDRDEQLSWAEERLPKPPPAAGYTGNTLITEWLTVNCRGDWASHSGGRSLRVRFAEPSDRERAVARFGARERN